MQAVYLSFTGRVPCSLARSPDSPGLSPSLLPRPLFPDSCLWLALGSWAAHLKCSADAHHTRDQPGQNVGDESEHLSF